MADMIECLSNDGIISALRSVYDKQMEDFQAIEKAYKSMQASKQASVLKKWGFSSRHGYFVRRGCVIARGI